jgi:hypothetical protein
VARRRPEILAEAGRPLEAGCVPQAHEPGAEGEAFLEGHVYAFGRLGGVPAEKIRYDNLTSAVDPTRIFWG